MFMTRKLQLIDKNLDKFKLWACYFDCVKQHFYCKKYNLVWISVL